MNRTAGEHLRAQIAAVRRRWFAGRALLWFDAAGLGAYAAYGAAKALAWTGEALYDVANARLRAAAAGVRTGGAGGDVGVAERIGFDANGTRQRHGITRQPRSTRSPRTKRKKRTTS